MANSGNLGNDGSEDGNKKPVVNVNILVDKEKVGVDKVTSERVDRILRLRPDKEKKVIENMEEDEPNRFGNDLIIEDGDEDAIKFLSSKEEKDTNGKINLKEKKVLELKDPLPVKVAVKMFEKRKIGELSNITEKSDSEQEEEKVQEGDGDKEESIEVINLDKEEKGKEDRKPELRPGEFTEEELNDNSGEKNTPEFERVEEEIKKKVNNDTPIKNASGWDSFPVVETDEDKKFAGFGAFGDIFSKSDNNGGEAKDANNFDPFSSTTNDGGVWSNFGGSNVEFDKPQEQLNIEVANPIFGNFSKKDTNEQIISKDENQSPTKPLDESSMSRRKAFKKQNRSIIVESERMSSNSLSRSRNKSNSQKVIPSFKKSKRPSTDQKKPIVQILKPDASVINEEVLTESDKQDVSEVKEALDKNNKSGIKESDLDLNKDLLAGLELDQEKELNDPSDAFSPSKEVDLSGQIFDLNAFADVSQSINDSNLDLQQVDNESNPVEKEVKAPEVKMDFLNFDKNENDILGYNSMLIPQDTIENKVDPFLTAQSMVEVDDSQLKPIDNLKIDNLQPNTVLQNLTPRDTQAKEDNQLENLKKTLKTEEPNTVKPNEEPPEELLQSLIKTQSQPEIHQAEPLTNPKLKKRLSDGQANIVRDPTPVEKKKEFSFDSKDNPIKVVSDPSMTPKQKKKVTKEPKPTNDDPFSAFDALSEPNMTHEMDDSTQNGFNFGFDADPKEDSIVWNLDQSNNPDNIFRSNSNLEESKESNELDNLINESLNESKLQMQDLDNEVKEMELHQDDPFNTFKTAFIDGSEQ